MAPGLHIRLQDISRVRFPASREPQGSISRFQRAPGHHIALPDVSEDPFEAFRRVWGSISSFQINLGIPFEVASGFISGFCLGVSRAPFQASRGFQDISSFQAPPWPHFGIPKDSISMFRGLPGLHFGIWPRFRGSSGGPGWGLRIGPRFWVRFGRGRFGCPFQAASGSG